MNSRNRKNTRTVTQWPVWLTCTPTADMKMEVQTAYVRLLHILGKGPTHNHDMAGTTLKDLYIPLLQTNPSRWKEVLATQIVTTSYCINQLELHL